MMTVKQKDFKSPPNHMQTLIDGASVLNWVFLNGAGQDKEWAEEIINQVGFYGNKVRNLDREKDSAWYEAYLDLQ